jgi:F-type H+-transporting ATPase subunit epsilon
MPDKTLSLLVLTPSGILYEGPASSVIVPGEKGILEIQPYHKRLFSLLLRGKIIVDGHPLEIRRGIVKVGLNQVTLIVEEAA